MDSATGISLGFCRQIEGYGLTTAQILYRMPDHHSLIQEFIWQDYDMAPRFPALHRFLDFWRANLEGPLHRVVISHADLISATDLRHISGDFRLN